MKKTVLGIDPGTNKTGYAILSFDLENGEEEINYIKSGFFKTKAAFNHQEKIFFISNEVDKLIKEFNPDYFTCEDQYNGLNVRTLKMLRDLVGIFFYLASQNNLPLTLQEPSRIKKYFTGKGNASKEEMTVQAQKTYKLKTIPEENEADAIGIATSHILQLREAIKGEKK